MYLYIFLLSFIFISGRLTLDEACWVDGQCTGTPNSGVCMPDKNKNGKLLCQCSIASIRHNNNCLPGTFCNFACVFLYNLTIKYTKKIRYLIPISLFFYCVANVENNISFACTNVV